MNRPADVLAAEALPARRALDAVQGGRLVSLFVDAAAPCAESLHSISIFERVSPSRSIKKWICTARGSIPLTGRRLSKVQLNRTFDAPLRPFMRSQTTAGAWCCSFPDANEIESRLAGRPDPAEQILRPMAQEIELWDPTGSLCRVMRRNEASVTTSVPIANAIGHYNADGYALLASFVAEKILGEAQAFR